MNIETVNELIASLESAGELSIREQKFLKLAKAYQQLAAENVALKQAAEFATAPDMWVEQADGMLDYRYHEWYVDVLKAAMETPATDRIVAGIKADGVEEWVSSRGGRWNGTTEEALKFAKQLREGKSEEVKS
ncbi:hypothetical protein SQ56_14970 [Klebsiella variicola]|uniref:hypothetical protein n=1 Tax=Klebsiella variicola TaxID=244366 RepID=UPI000B401DC2|nr:hypothetical protein [Klebsiella variicola]OVE59618.1 hypothetical protein SQ56_14970 [Klebsiella variicola]